MTEFERLFSRIADEHYPDRHSPEVRHVNYATLTKASDDDYVFREGPSLNILEPIPGTDGVARAWVDDVEVSIEDAADVLAGTRTATSIKAAGHDPGDEDRER